MGGYHRTTAPAFWTLLCCLLVRADERGLFADLGLAAPFDAAKINVSLEEYTRMMNLYLETRRQGAGETVPDLLTFYSEPSRRRSRLKFRVESAGEVESAQLRLLVPACAASNARLAVHQVVGPRRRRLLDERPLLPAADQPAWRDLDVTAAVRVWAAGGRNLGLEVEGGGCGPPLRAAVSALVRPRRARRAASSYEPDRRTDCRLLGKARRRCCRHKWSVAFADLHFPEMASIVQPRTYEAGYCQGQCPPNFNHATNHSRIQSLLHQMGKRAAKRAIPKACCTPSKLEPVEILRVNPSDATKLVVEKWDNMRVVECACS